MRIKEVIVVEGRDDTTKVQQAVQANTIETNGSAVNQETIERIRHAQEKRGVIVFTDPDYPGERVRRIITEAIPGCKHAFLTQDEARAKHYQNKSLGIEHASIHAIKEALSAVYELTDMKATDITKDDLLHYRLISGAGAARRREQLGRILKIGTCNGKQLLKRLQMFQIERDVFIAAAEAVLGKEE